MGCISGIMRIIMFVFNFVCLIIGIILIVLGSMAYYAFDKFEQITQGLFNAVPAVIIAVGVFIAILSFLGCCGTLKTSKCMLYLYAGILIIILVIQLGVSIYGLVEFKKDSNWLNDNIRKGMKEVFKNYETNDASKRIFNEIQTLYSCCGVDGAKDYRSSIPQSCHDKTGEIYNEGCFVKFTTFITDQIKIISIVSLFMCVIELLGSLFAIYIVKS